MEQIDVIASTTGTIQIRKDPATGAVLYELEGWGQSAADANGISMASYIHALFGLLSQTRASKILILGGGGCTLATMLTRARKTAIVVDIDPQAFLLAREYFHLPDSVTCHVADAAAFLEGSRESFDAIVMDVFVGDQIPAHLQTADFFALARSRLAPDGVMLVNVHVKHDFDDFADRIAKAMRGTWPLVRVLDAMGQCPRNAIVLAGRVSDLREPVLVIPPRNNPNGIRTALGQLGFRPWKSSRWDFGR